MADKKKAGVNRQIVGFTKPGKKILFFTIKPKPIYKNVEASSAQSGRISASAVKTAATQVEAQIDQEGGGRRVEPSLRTGSPRRWWRPG